MLANVNSNYSIDDVTMTTSSYDDDDGYLLRYNDLIDDMMTMRIVGKLDDNGMRKTMLDSSYSSFHNDVGHIVV